MGTAHNLRVSWMIPSLLIVVVLICPFAHGKVIYVDLNATGARDGSSWIDAHKCLQDALADARSGDEIRVAQGIYKPDQRFWLGRGGPKVLGSGDRTETFQLINGVTIKGGYAGVGEPDPDARDIELYETILSGDLEGNDRPYFANNSENSYHVVTGSGTDETAVLDGFSITAGNANGSDPHGAGGGMHSSGGNSSPTVTNCTFSGNSANTGGGMHTYGGNSPTVTNCTFSGNSAQLDGGGMRNDAGSNTIVTSCIFTGNSARRGGGISNQFSNPIVTNCTFTSNSASSGGGGMANRNCSPVVIDCIFNSNSAEVGGGMNDDGGNPTVTNCTFTGNSAKDGAGMVNGGSNPIVTNCTFIQNSANDDGSGIINFNSNPTITNCIFEDNWAKNGGGGVSSYDSNPILTNCIFSGNSTGGEGGGMFNINNSRPIVTNCIFTGNSAGWDGGGVWNNNSSPMLINCIFRGNSTTDRGGGIFNIEDCETTIINCTFNGNSATTGGAMYSREKSYSTLSNSILWGNTATGGLQISVCEHSSMAIDYCDLQGGLPEIDVDQNSSVAWGSGNTDVDPLFIDAADADYHLQVGSPCINAGDNSSIPSSVVEDFDGNPRIIGDIVDMGAYEYMLQLRAFNPIPADGAVDVTQTPTLHWTAGERAILHDVYLGTDENAMINATLRSPEYKGSQDLGSESYEPAKLQWGTTYYWRIDEVNADDTISKGDVWSFTVLVVPDPLAESLDTDLSFTTGGDADWRYQSAASFYDGDAAQSGDISHNQESWMQTSVTGPTTVTFYWKVSSEADYDFLEFYIDGSLQDQISGSVDWQQKIYTITTSGSHTLEWRYVKDKGLDSGSDCGWVDKLECGLTPAPSPPPADSLAEALDTDLSFTTGGSADWFSQTVTYYHDGDAAQSGPISSNQESWLQTKVSGAGTLSFYWKVLSEADFDFLEFYIDGLLQEGISGSEDWHVMTYEITGSDLHTLEWRYTKDASINRGSDCGWVDKVVWVSTP